MQLNRAHLERAQSDARQKMMSTQSGVTSNWLQADQLASLSACCLKPSHLAIAISLRRIGLDSGLTFAAGNELVLI